MPRTLNFTSPEKLVLLAERGHAFTKRPEARESLIEGIKRGKGAVVLELTDDEFAKLKAAS